MAYFKNKIDGRANAAQGSPSPSNRRGNNYSKGKRQKGDFSPSVKTGVTGRKTQSIALDEALKYKRAKKKPPEKAKDQLFGNSTRGIARKKFSRLSMTERGKAKKSGCKY